MIFDIRIKKASIICLITILLVLGSLTPATAESEKIFIEYFHKPKCKTCGGQPNSEGFDAIIKELENEYGSQLETEWIDCNEQENLQRLALFNITLTPAVVLNKEYFLIRDEINPDSLREVVDALLDPSETPPSKGGLVSISATLIVISGLVDGINPCAISLLVFFISFLIGLKRTRMNIYWMGLAYIVGLFIVYLSLGLGLLKAVTLFGIEHPFGKIGVLILIILGVLNLRDAYSWGESVLKLPKSAVPIVKSLTEKGAIPAALILGGFVSVCEFACSGGVYVGILVLLSTSAKFWQGFSYLVLYNLMFVAPLLLILIIGSHAETLARIDEWRVIRRRQMKAIGGSFMILLGVATYAWLYLLN